ncbi:MAG: DUF4391 domain-containing protein [Bacteroidota bacterium]
MSVIDWTFKSPWFLCVKNKYALNLKKNLDAVYHDLCLQLSSRSAMANVPLSELVEYSKQRDLLEKEIEQLRRGIKNAKQYKEKVALNVQLKKKIEELKSLPSENH